MKQFSLILNVILLAAVIGLYVKVFSGSKKSTPTAVSAKKDSSETSIASTAIAYVELDSLNEKITYIKNRREELEREQKAIEADWRNGYTGLENKKNEFLKKGSAITQQEAEKFQGVLMQQQQEIDAKKQNLNQALSEKSYKFMDDLQKKLKDFLSDYNKDKRYQYILTTGTGMDYMLYKDESSNITDEVIKGMNELMNTKK
jgi:outer membrane protein